MRKSSRTKGPIGQFLKNFENDTICRKGSRRPVSIFLKDKNPSSHNVFFLIWYRLREKTTYPQYSLNNQQTLLRYTTPFLNYLLYYPLITW